MSTYKEVGLRGFINGELGRYRLVKQTFVRIEQAESKLSSVLTEVEYSYNNNLFVYGNMVKGQVVRHESTGDGGVGFNYQSPFLIDQADGSWFNAATIFVGPGGISHLKELY